MLIGRGLRLQWGQDEEAMASSPSIIDLVKTAGQVTLRTTEV